MQIEQIEDNIKKLTASEFGEKHNIVLAFSQLEEIPIDSYSRLQELMWAGEANMRQYPLSTASNVFNLIATESEQLQFNIIMPLSFFMPITAAILLSFIYSWWFSLFSFISIIAPPRLGKRIYLHALFNRAANSEIAFCFLFSGNYITLELPGLGIIKRHNTNKETIGIP